MTDRQHRSAITGKFVTAEHAEANPDTTVSEARIRIEPVEFRATYGVTLSDPAKLTRATGNPNTTVTESPCAECERLRGVIHTQGVAIDGYREEVERLQADRPVRTVGDLTARHIGRRVRIGKTPPAALMGLSWREVGIRVHLFTPDADAAWQNLPLNTPCEVLS